MNTNLNDDNFMIYAIKAYSKPNCIMSEFEDDLNRIKYVKRLVKRYRTTGEIKHRLILNHLIILSNVFGVEATVKLLFYKFDSTDYQVLKTFLLYLNYLPDVVYGIGENNIITGDIHLDLELAKILQQELVITG